MADGSSAISQMIALGKTAIVLAKVLLIVGCAVVIFTTAYLGYFILPFTFVLVALSIVGMSNLLKQWSRLRHRRRSDS
jgi:uncharacterized membrane protein